MNHKRTQSPSHSSQRLQVDTGTAKTEELFGILTELWKKHWVTPRVVDSVRYLPNSLVEEYDESEDDSFVRGLLHGIGSGEDGYWDPLTEIRLTAPNVENSVSSLNIRARHGNLVILKEDIIDGGPEGLVHRVLHRLYDITRNVEVHRLSSNYSSPGFIETGKNGTKLVKLFYDHDGDVHFKTSSNTLISILWPDGKPIIFVTRRFKKPNYKKYDDVWDGTIYFHEMMVRLGRGVMKATDCIEYNEIEHKLYYWIYSRGGGKKYMIDLKYWDAYMLEFVLRRNPLPTDLERKIQEFLW